MRSRTPVSTWRFIAISAVNLIGTCLLIISLPIYFIWTLIKEPLLFINKKIQSVNGTLCVGIGRTSFGMMIGKKLSRVFGPLVRICRTFLGRVIEKIIPNDGGDALQQLEFQTMQFINDPRVSPEDKLLIAGQRREYAEMVVPPNKYPTLYVDIPKDLKRDIIADGRLLNGVAPARGLAGGALTPEFVQKAWGNATSAATKTSLSTLLIGITLSILASTTVGYGAYKLPEISKLTGRTKESEQTYEALARISDVSILAAQYEDVWTPEQAKALENKVNVIDTSSVCAAQVKSVVQGITQGLLTLVLLIVASVGFAYSSGRMWFIMSFRGRVFSGVNQAVEPLRHSWREAMQRWRERLAIREAEQENYADQVHFATQIDRSPLIDIGKSLGIFEFKGHLLAPQQHQQVCMSVMDLLSHISILGGTGEMKSRAFFVPFVRQLLELRKKGYPIAIYGTDDKGAIYIDILAICRELEIPEEDIVVIGTGPNDYRVDLLDGLTPVEMTDIMSSIAKQVGGDSGADIWPQMASDLILQIATVLVAYELTDTGNAWMKKNNMRAYSLLNILRVASSDVEIEGVLEVVVNAMNDENDQYENIQHLDKNGLHAACDFLAYTFLGMVDVTKIGIIVNVRASLRSFAFKEEISDGFATGYHERIISAQEIISNKIKLINVSQIEHGLAGRMVCIMLKTLLFKQARAAQQKNPEFADERLKWWFNPQLGPDAAKNYINVFLADEYQSLITNSVGDGLSDGSVWNVLRSAGVAGVVISQSLSAYRLMVGDKAVDNFTNNFRSRIYLRTEDTPTLEVMRTLVGKTQRFQSMEWDHMEGAVAARRETGLGAENCVSEWHDEMDGMSVQLNNPGLLGKFEFPGYAEAYQHDERHVIGLVNSSVTGHGNYAEHIQSVQAAHWRQEDKTLGAMQHGSSKEDCFEASDLMAVGRGRALVLLQRAGGTRVDIIKLNAQ